MVSESRDVLNVDVAAGAFVEAIGEPARRPIEDGQLIEDAARGATITTARDAEGETFGGVVRVGRPIPLRSARPWEEIPAGRGFRLWDTVGLGVRGSVAWLLASTNRSRWALNRRGSGLR